MATGYYYCAEKYANGEYADMFRRKGTTYEQYIMDDDEWKETVDAARAYNGEIFTTGITEEDALRTAKEWRKNYLAWMEKHGDEEEK